MGRVISAASRRSDTVDDGNSELPRDSRRLAITESLGAVLIEIRVAAMTRSHAAPCPDTPKLRFSILTSCIGHHQQSCSARGAHIELKLYSQELLQIYIGSSSLES